MGQNWKLKKLVMVFSTGILAAAKSFSLPEKPKQFVECEMDDQCLEKWKGSLLEVNVPQLLNQAS